MNLSEIIESIYPLPDRSLRLIEAEAEEISVERGIDIIRAGRLERFIYFVKKGIVRAYVVTDAREVTFWIGEEGSVALSMQSYVNGRPGYESIMTMENSLLYRINSEKLQKLYTADTPLANWGRRFAEMEIIKAEMNLIPQLTATASERYTALLGRNPGIFNRIPLEHLATYLGVTPVSLSRIRRALIKT